ncbi:MAG TPA: DUF3394 domain-containing protein, partial [Alphaproteobacteria bacterium]|nr:DUF3394 domain-containing protein [Alphaproteobacteria bacterium]
DGARLPIVVEGDNLEGETIRKTVTIRIAGAPGDGRARLTEAGLRIVPGASGPMVGPVQFGSYAKRAGLEPGQQILAVKVPADRPSPYLMFIPALALLGIVVALQRARRGRAGASPAAERVTA